MKRLGGLRKQLALAVLLSVAVLGGCKDSGTETDAVALNGRESQVPANEAGRQGEVETEGEDQAAKDLSSQVREIVSPKKALLSAATPYGVDGPQLFYYDEEYLYFYDYYGVVIFQYTDKENSQDFNPGIVDTLDLKSLGCEATQGDAAALMVASPDGERIFFHAMNGDVMYEYLVEEQRLFEKPVSEMPESGEWFHLPEDMSGFINQNVLSDDKADRGYFRFWGERTQEKLWDYYCLGNLEFVMDGDRVIPIWTESTAVYMKKLKAMYDEESFQVSDNGWSQVTAVPEMATGEDSGWFNVVELADQDGNAIEDEWEKPSYFLYRKEGEPIVRIPVRRYESLLYADGEYLVSRYQQELHFSRPVKGQDVEWSLGAAEFTVGAGGGAAALYRCGDLLAVSGSPYNSAGLVFYDKEFQKVREYSNVRLEADGYSEGLFCLMRLEDGLYGYVDGNGELTIPFQYSRAYPFKNGYAAVLCGAENEFYTEDGGNVAMFDSIGGQWAIIDKVGTFAVEPEEKYSNSFARADIPKMPSYVGGPVRFGEVREDGTVDFYEVENHTVLYEVEVK